MIPRSATGLHPAVFLDRDGTIIEEFGDLAHPSQVIFYGETFDALRRLGERFALFMVTNQSGVAKGSITLREVESVNAAVVSRLAADGIEIVETYVCPHLRVEGCRCIKPNPYFPLQAQKKHGIDLARSWVIGDHPHDVDLAANCGATGIYLLTGHGEKHRVEVPPGTVVVRGIGEAVEYILKIKPSPNQ